MNLNNPKRASFKENHPMTTARDALRTTSIYRFSTYENNLNFLNQTIHIQWHVTLRLIYSLVGKIPCSYGQKSWQDVFSDMTYSYCVAFPRVRL
jgi:hypothetical protein